MDVYHIRKGRFVLHTTGPMALSRFVRSKRMHLYVNTGVCLTKWHTDQKESKFYFQDHKTNLWIKHGKSVLVY